MSKPNINNKGKMVHSKAVPFGIALASLAGLTFVHNNGISNHLAGVLDSVAISSAQAQTSPSPAPVPQPQPEVVPLDLLIEQSGADRIVVQENRAVGVFEDGTAVPLADGTYSGEGIMFTVENMTVTSCEGCEEEDELWSAEYCMGGSCDDHSESDATSGDDIFSPISPTTSPTEPNPVPPASEQVPMDEPGITPSVEPVDPVNPAPMDESGVTPSVEPINPSPMDTTPGNPF